MKLNFNYYLCLSFFIIFRVFYLPASFTICGFFVKEMLKFKK